MNGHDDDIAIPLNANYLWSHMHTNFWFGVIKKQNVNKLGNYT